MLIDRRFVADQSPVGIDRRFVLIAEQHASDRRYDRTAPFHVTCSLSRVTYHPSGTIAQLVEAGRNGGGDGGGGVGGAEGGAGWSEPPSSQHRSSPALPQNAHGLQAPPSGVPGAASGSQLPAPPQPTKSQPVICSL